MARGKEALATANARLREAKECLDRTKSELLELKARAESERVEHAAAIAAIQREILQRAEAKAEERYNAKFHQAVAEASTKEAARLHHEAAGRLLEAVLREWSALRLGFRSPDAWGTLCAAVGRDDMATKVFEGTEWGYRENRRMRPKDMRRRVDLLRQTKNDYRPDADGDAQ